MVRVAVMRAKDYTLSIIVKDRPIDEYLHEGRTFVEGRKGSDFELSFKNTSKSRVLVVPSVDGLSPLDGQTAGPESRGYIVAAGATLVIPGWTITDDQVAKFIFENKEKSYGSHTDGGTTNAGVVGVLVYAEKQEPKAKEIHHHHHHTTTTIQPVNPYPVWPQPIYPPYPRVWYGSSIGDLPVGSGLTASAVRSARNDMSLGAFGATTSSIASLNSIQTSGATVNDTMNHGTPTGAPLEVEESPFGLGAGWGEKADFKINHTTFNRGDLVAQMVIYYDTRRNLEKRGIEIRPQRISYSEELPQAFVSVGCTPPPGWRG